MIPSNDVDAASFRASKARDVAVFGDHFFLFWNTLLLREKHCV